MSVSEPERDADRTSGGGRAGPAHAKTTGRRWRTLVVGILVVGVAAVVALLLAQSAGAVHLSVLGAVPAVGR